MTKKELVEYFERGFELVGSQMSEQDREAVESCLRELKEGKQEEEEKAWPQVGDDYYTVNSSGNIDGSSWDDDSVDEERMKVGNCFKTYEEAELKSERVHVLAEMEKFAEPFGTKWDGDTYHYYILCDVDDDCLKVDNHTIMRSGELYFESRTRAEECIEAVGEDRIKKYYLGVE